MTEYAAPDRQVKVRDELFFVDFKTYPQCPRQFKYYDRILRGTEIHRRIEAQIDSNFLNWTKTLELVADPVARLILSKRIANELAGRGIEVNFS